MMNTSQRPEDEPRESEEARDTAAITQHEQVVIPVLREELDVGTRRVETDAGARVIKTVEREEHIVDEPLTREEVQVERVALNRPVDGPVAVRYEGDTMVIPVLEEVLVVEKRLVLKEEIRITRRATAYRDPQRVVVRREHAAVERIEDTELQDSPPTERGAPRETQAADSLLEQKRREERELRRQLSTPPGPD